MRGGGVSRKTARQYFDVVRCAPKYQSDNLDTRTGGSARLTKLTLCDWFCHASCESAVLPSLNFLFTLRPSRRRRRRGQGILEKGHCPIVVGQLTSNYKPTIRLAANPKDAQNHRLTTIPIARYLPQRTCFSCRSPLKHHFQHPRPRRQSVDSSRTYVQY